MTPAKHKLLITSLNPSDLGGVISMQRAFLAALPQDGTLEAALAYTALDNRSAANVTLASLVRGRFAPRVHERRTANHQILEVGTYFPRLESLRWSFNRSLWRQVCGAFDRHVAISGYALDALPYALLDVPFVIWVATDFESERKAILPYLKPAARVASAAQWQAIKRREEFVLRKARWVFALSEKTRENLLPLGVNPATMTVLNYPIDASRWLPSSVDATAAPVIVWSARLDDPRKNTDMLLRAFARVHAAQPRARLHLLGSLATQRLVAYAAELGIADRVAFLGEKTQAELSAIFQNAHVFVVPSRQEGLGISGLEALAAGLPVVSTRCGGPESYAQPGKTGYLVNDEGQMAAAICELLEQPGLMKRLGANGRKLIESEYSPSGFRRQISDAFARVWGAEM